MERLPDRLHVRLLRPLFASILASHRSRGRAAPLERAPSYPYGRLVQAFAGSPIAPVLARTLEDMWVSPVLTRRCKVLMFAVIERGLGCSACESEAARTGGEAGLTERALAEVLIHLDAPDLDPVERLLVPFARETIWYEPAPLQRRARALRDGLSSPQFLEAVGVASLANGLCRIGAVVADHPC
jgi:alkylhydroperoxidase family enzyme